MLFKEFDRLKQLNNENILEINDVWVKESDKLIFITDYFSGGSIRQFNYSN